MTCHSTITEASLNFFSSRATSLAPQARFDRGGMVNFRQSDYKPFSWVQLELVPGLSLLGLLDGASAAPFSPLEGACGVLFPSPRNEDLKCDECQKVCLHALLME